MLIETTKEKKMPTSIEYIGYLNVRPNHLAYRFVNSLMEFNKFLWQKSHYQTAKILKSWTDIYITIPDKDLSVVILNYFDYVAKMSTILYDINKLQKLGDI